MVTTIVASRPIVPGGRYNVATQYTSATRFFLNRQSSLNIDSSDWAVVRTVLIYPALPISAEWLINSFQVFSPAFTFVLSGTTANPQKFYLYFPRKSYLQSGTFSLYSDP